jgi:hypothetical protein
MINNRNPRSQNNGPARTRKWWNVVRKESVMLDWGLSIMAIVWMTIA